MSAVDALASAAAAGRARRRAARRARLSRPADAGPDRGRDRRRARRWPALLAPLIAPYGPNQLDFLSALQPPSLSHLFGTDDAGRDVFSPHAVRAAARPRDRAARDLRPAADRRADRRRGRLLRRLVDGILARITDMMIAFPFIVLVIAVIAIVGPGVKGVLIGVPIVAWALYARLARSEMLVLREQPFMLATTALGYSKRRAILRHAVPNLMRSSLIYSTLDMVVNLLLLAGPRLPRPRRAAAERRAGIDHRRRPDHAADRLVDRDAARAGASCSSASVPACSATACPTGGCARGCSERHVEPLLTIDGLRVEFDGPDGRLAGACRDAGLSIEPGEIVGLVGESGSGKTPHLPLGDPPRPVAGAHRRGPDRVRRARRARR